MTRKIRGCRVVLPGEGGHWSPGRCRAGDYERRAVWPDAGSVLAPQTTGGGRGEIDACRSAVSSGAPMDPFPGRSHMARLEKVVAGIDFSDASVAAVRWTSRWFAPDAELILVHVLDVPKPPAFLRPL